MLRNERIFHAGTREKMREALFLRCYAPGGEVHSPALNVGFPLLVAFDVHSQEMLARPALKTAYTNGGGYCQQYPNLSQSVLMASRWSLPVVPLPL